MIANIKMRLPLALAAGLWLGTAQAAFAADAATEQRLDRLEGRLDALENAVKARDATIEGLQRAVQQRDAKIESLEKAAAQAQQTAAQAEKTAVAAAKPAAGPVTALQSADGKVKFAFRGRIDADAGLYANDKGSHDFNSGTLLRRARMGLDGTLYDDFAWRIEAEFGQGNAVSLTDAYVAYTGLSPVTLIMGQHKTPYTLEDRTSANFITFMERGLFVDAFNAGANRKIGISAKAADKHWNAWLGAFGENAQVSGPADEGWGINGNFGVTPVNEAGRLLHLGGSGYYRGPDASHTVRFSDTPEIQIDSTRLADTGTVSAQHYWFTGAEMAAVYGPFSVQGEYGRAGIDRATAGEPDVAFDGYYAFASYFLTGESRVFKDGAFDRLKPKADFSLSKGGIGAWEIAARFSRLDLNDHDIRGGRETNSTLALNWYLNPNMRAGLNWVHLFVDNIGKSDESADAVGGRLHVDW